MISIVRIRIEYEPGLCACVVAQAMIETFKDAVYAATAGESTHNIHTHAPTAPVALLLTSTSH
jgi:hypothetical protein